MTEGSSNIAVAPDLLLRRIGRRFGDYWAADSVNLRIQANRITALIGPNGAGKTTVFHIVSGDLRPDTGTVLYGGSDITGLAPWRIARRGIGKAFQDARIFGNLSTGDQVLTALLGPAEEGLLASWFRPKGIARIRRRRSAEIMRWLEFVGLQDKRNDLGRELSYGQQKLLSFARLMAGGYSLFLLDEPTAGVSPHMIRKIERLLLRLVEEENKTIAIIEHNMSVVSQLANWVYFMHEGRVAFSGRTDHVLGDEEVRKTYMGF